MIDELANLLNNFPGEANRTRCLTHILNLVAKSIIKQFDIPKARANEVLDDAAKELAALAVDLDIEEQISHEDPSGDGEDDADEDDNVDGLTDVCDGLSREEREVLDESLQPLRKTAFAIKNSSTLILPRWYAVLKELKINERIMPRDVSTRWNLTYDMLKFSLDYRMALDVITGERDMKLQKYELKDMEWHVAGQLRDILELLKHATLFFSRATPNIATVIPVMDHLDQHLATSALNLALPASICAAATLGKRTLNKYYTMTDHSEVYQIAMVLHPRHKLDYFKMAKWDKEWIDAARQILCDEFECTYKAPPDADLTTQANGERGMSSKKTKNIFDSLPAICAPKAADLCDELDRYLSTDPEHTDDVLLWRAEQRGLYPCLSRMVLNYLSIPATSVDVECMFSKG